ncbi:hypothetical protein AX17_003427 [Amanita inopinata Kibby_2008]|nr:hypothetical protein AX17_003427 [Amanita inopinata Kibby_2008]
MANYDSSNYLVAESQLAIEHASPQFARKSKAERTKDLGSPIQLSGKALALHVRGSYAWIAENTHSAKKIDLESGKTLHAYKGHTGPVTCLAFCDKVKGSGDGKILITGSWDQTIKLWDTDTKTLISSTNAHSDFVKTLLVFPSLQLLVSSSSDKSVRFWDLSDPTGSNPLAALGSISAHTRPVECLDGLALSEENVTLFTADTMGIIKIWDLTKEESVPARWRSNLKTELNHHRTGINEMIFGNNELWTASTDESVRVLPEFSNHMRTKLPSPISHPVAVRAILPLSLTAVSEPYLITGAGDVLRIYDVSNLEEPDLMGEVDVHWHDITSIRLWVRRVTTEGAANPRVEPWIVTASLDGTIRKWQLSELLNPSSIPGLMEAEPPQESDPNALTEEEERELADLMDD